MSLVLLVGATATGKTAVGIALARHLGAEILSIDSRQAYRLLAIGTAKPTAAERDAIRHHLLDLFAPTERASAQAFAAYFHTAREQIERRGKRPLSVGGSGLYVDACLGRLDPLPPADPRIRARHAAWRARLGPAALHAFLAEIDPESAARLAPRDFQRVSRALEVHELTGIALSRLQTRRGRLDLHGRAQMLVLERSRADLAERIVARADAMLAGGLLGEVEALLAAGVPPEAPAMQAIGYGAFVALLRGEISAAQAREAFIRHTRRYAKRQESWFRNRYRGTRRLRLDPDETPEAIAERALSELDQPAGGSSREA